MAGAKGGARGGVFGGSRGLTGDALSRRIEQVTRGTRPRARRN